MTVIGLKCQANEIFEKVTLKKSNRNLVYIIE